MNLIPIGRQATQEEPLRLGILVSGRGSNMEAIIRACQAGELRAHPAVVISDRPDVPALDTAKALGVDVVGLNYRSYASPGEYHQRLQSHLAQARVELVVLAGYMRILPADFVASHPLRIVNIHPSLLPSFPGLHPHKQAIDYGVKLSGATVHLVDEGVDSGPIIAQEAVAVHGDDTPDTLSERIRLVEHRLYPKAIALYGSGTLFLRGRQVVQRR